MMRAGDLNTLARQICAFEGGTVNLPIGQVKDVLAALGDVLRDQSRVGQLAILAALVERAGKRAARPKSKRRPA